MPIIFPFPVPPSSQSSQIQCTFPVCPSSSSQCILEAFKESGYFQQLNYQQQQAAQSNPLGWLSSHPYLYGVYPAYFTQNCGQAGAYISQGPSINEPEVGNPSQVFGSLFPNLSELQSQAQASQQVSSQQTSGNPIIQTGQDIYGAISGFGGFLEHFFGQTIPNLLTGGASALSTVTESLGKYPWGGILLIAIIIMIFIFSKI